MSFFKSHIFLQNFVVFMNFKNNESSADILLYKKQLVLMFSQNHEISCVWLFRKICSNNSFPDVWENSRF